MVTVSLAIAPSLSVTVRRRVIDCCTIVASGASPGCVLGTVIIECSNVRVSRPFPLCYRAVWVIGSGIERNRCAAIDRHVPSLNRDSRGLIRTTRARTVMVTVSVSVSSPSSTVRVTVMVWALAMPAGRVTTVLVPKVVLRGTVAGRPRKRSGTYQGRRRPFPCR